MNREGGPRHWWDDKRFLLLVVIIMAIPLLLPQLPPLVDLPGHMARYRVSLDIASSPPLQDFFSFQWRLIGNLGIDLLVIPLERIFGLELAVKLIVIAIPVLTASGMIWIAREVHGQIPPTLFFALPLAYGHPFHFGFVNFALAMALALNAFALWLRLGRLGRLKLRAQLFVPIGLLLWLCHTFGWATLCVLAFSAELVRDHDEEGGWYLPFVHAAIQCLSLAPPMLLMLAWRSDQGGGETGDWFKWDIKWRWLTMILRDRWMDFDKASVAMLVVVLLWAAVARILQFSRMLMLTTAFLCVTYVLLPRVVFGSAYADMRLTPYMLAFALIAIRPKPGEGSRAFLPVIIASLLFFGVRIGATTISFAEHGARANQALAALDHVPHGARMISFVRRECGLPWDTSRMEHLPAMATVRRHAFTNDQWNMPGGQLLAIKKADAPGFDRDASQLVSTRRCYREPWRPLSTSLAKFPRDAFDYLWLIDPPAYDLALVQGMTRIWSNGRDVLYRIDHHAKPGQKPA